MALEREALQYEIDDDVFQYEFSQNDVLVTTGRKKNTAHSSSARIMGSRIVAGSRVLVKDEQAAAVISGRTPLNPGRVVQCVAEPGLYVYQPDGTEREALSLVYLNRKEMTGNTFASDANILLRHVDEEKGIDLDVFAALKGTFSYRIGDPEVFLRNNYMVNADDFKCGSIDTMASLEVKAALEIGIAALMNHGHTMKEISGEWDEMTEAMRAALVSAWDMHRGLELVHFSVEECIPEEKDSDLMAKLEEAAAALDPAVQAMMLLDQIQKAMGDAHWQCECGFINKTKFCPNCGKKGPWEGKAFLPSDDTKK